MKKYTIPSLNEFKFNPNISIAESNVSLDMEFADTGWGGLTPEDKN